MILQRAAPYVCVTFVRTSYFSAVNRHPLAFRVVGSLKRIREEANAPCPYDFQLSSKKKSVDRAVPMSLYAPRLRINKK